MAVAKAHEPAAQLTVTAVFEESDGWIVAWVEEIPGVNTQGRTMEEARANLVEALAMIVEYNRKRSREETGATAVRERLTFNV